MTGCKERERDLSERWHQSAQSVATIAEGERAKGFPKKISGELEDMRAEIRRSNQMLQSPQNAVDFYRSCLEV